MYELSNNVNVNTEKYTNQLMSSGHTVMVISKYTKVKLKIMYNIQSRKEESFKNTKTCKQYTNT